MKLKKGDQVIVLSGKDRGQTGTILKVLPKLNKVLVDGINTVKRAYKPTQADPRGGLKTEPRPVYAGKVAIVHPNHPKKGSRIGHVIKDGKKARVYRQAANQLIKESK